MMLSFPYWDWDFIFFIFYFFGLLAFGLTYPRIYELFGARKQLFDSSPLSITKVPHWPSRFSESFCFFSFFPFVILLFWSLWNSISQFLYLLLSWIFPHDMYSLSFFLFLWQFCFFFFISFMPLKHQTYFFIAALFRRLMALSRCPIYFLDNRYGLWVSLFGQWLRRGRSPVEHRGTFVHLSVRPSFRPSIRPLRPEICPLRPEICESRDRAWKDRFQIWKGQFQTWEIRFKA